MSKAQKFALAFVCSYFIFVFSFMSKLDVDKPLPIWIRWVPLCGIVLALIVVAMLSRKADRTTPTRHETPGVPTHTNWPVKGMLFLYSLTLLGTVVALAAGSLPLRFAIPGLFVNIVLITFFSWLDRARNSRPPV